MDFAYWAGLLFILLIIFSLALPIIIGIFVYRDAKSRGMEAVLWMIVVMILPLFIGLILYLVVRGNYQLRRCPRCGCEIENSFANCPNCGYYLSKECRQCGARLKPEWRVCPSCGTEIEDAVPDAVHKNDTGMGLIVIITLLIIILAAGLIIFGIAAYNMITIDNSAVIYNTITSSF